MRQAQLPGPWCSDIDTHPGADDAIALMMALRHAEVQAVAITTFTGNVPVYQGTDRPMLRPLVLAHDV